MKTINSLLLFFLTTSCFKVKLSFRNPLTIAGKVVMVCSVFVLATNASMAQDPAQSTVPSFAVSMPSPEVAALGKYGDIPVNLYTGVPNISVPIYNIKLKGIEIPISLSYHSSGVKADELASNVGLGWTLQNGGAVIPTIHGVPDDESTGWLNIIPNYRMPEGAGDLPNYWCDWNCWEIDPDYEMMKRFSDNLFDSQPDLYQVSMNGRSFRFFYSQEGIPFTMPYQAVKFTHGIHELGYDGFEIIDESGIKYIFQEEEVSETAMMYYGYENAAGTYSKFSSYYLSSITTPQGDTVKYTYEAYQYEFKNQISETRYAQHPLGVESYIPNSRHTESKTTIQGKRVTRILTNRGHDITFSYDLVRQDLPAAKALSTIVIKSALTGEVRNSFKLEYGYFGSAADNIVDPDDYRLKLLSVKQEGVPPYLFEYNNEVMPKRLSKAQDHWGYINGVSATTMLPYDPANGFTSGAYRDPNPSMVQTGILTKMTYPTSGYTTFFYEPNDITLTKKPISEANASLEAIAYQLVTMPFTVKEGADQKSFRIDFKAPNGAVIDSATGNLFNCYVSIKKSDGTNMYSFAGESISGGDNPYLIYSRTNPMPPGEYYLEIDSRGGSVEAFIIVKWLEEGAPVTETQLTGGLRIASMVHESLLGPTEKKVYSYKRSSNPNESSGVENFRPDYIYPHYIYIKNSVLDIEEDQFVAQSSSSSHPIGIMGGAVAYSEVTVHTESETKGFTHNIFSFGGGVDGTWDYPFGPIIHNDWMDGHLLESTDYIWKETEAVYRPVRKIINDFRIEIGGDSINSRFNNSVWGAKITVNRPPFPWRLPEQPGGGGQFAAPFFNISDYTLHSVWVIPTGKTEIFYDPADETKQVVSRHDYFYEAESHNKVTREEIDRSRDGKLTVKYRYAKDIQASVYNVNPMVERRVYAGNTELLVNADLTLYEDREGIFPNKFFTLNSPTSIADNAVPIYQGAGIAPQFQERSNVQYDISGNVVTVVSNSGAPVSYTWDSQGVMPTATVNNASPDQIFFTSFEETGTEGDAKSGRRYHVGAYTFTPPTGFAPAAGSLLTYWRWTAATDQWTFEEQPYNGGTATCSGDRIDEVRVHPANAHMTTYTYDPLLGLTSVTDANGKTQYYEYDGLGRLQLVRDQDGNILKQHEYIYKQ